jgi:nucleoside-diphosphate-sugar epimerase
MPHPRQLALVTGGSGYFGGVVACRLCERGYRVRVLDLNDVDDRPDDVEFVRGDIRDLAVVTAACNGVDVVHHNVAQVPLAKDRALFDSVNIGGARTLFEACSTQRVRKIVNVSSSAVFGVPASNPVDETVSPRPGEAYGRAKLAAERIAAHFVDRGLDITTIRPRTILGHGRLGIFQILFELVRQGRPLYLLGDGSNRFQFVHADDLADACVRAGERAGAEIFNIGADRFGTMRQLLEALARHAGTASVVRCLPMGPAVAMMKLTSSLSLSPLGPYHALMYGREMFFDTRLAQDKLGWTPRFSNEEMICESYDAYVSDREAILARRGASHHRSAVKFGVLALLRYLP